jgi:drug/metabolite transporter (DMT)-like permease
VTAPAKHVWLALAVVYVVWGSTYFGIKIAVDTIPPLIAAGSRFLTAAILLAAILAWRGTSLRITRAELHASAIAGGLLLGLGVGMVHVAETRIDSSVAAMIAGTVPLQIILLRLLAAESPARATRLSTLAGLAGLALVVAPGLGAGSTALGLAVMISSTMAWSTGSFLSKRLTLPQNPFVTHSSRPRGRWASGERSSCSARSRSASTEM